MRKFINIIENNHEDEYDETEDTARFSREKHVETLIRYAFGKIGLRISDSIYSNSVIYIEENDREAQVKLDDLEVDLDHLLRLKETGLSSEYIISTSGDFNITILFRVDPAIDSAKID